VNARLDAATPSVPDAVRALDPVLPDIGASFDLSTVARRFARHWRTTVTGCTLLGARYDPGVRCVTTYAVETTERLRSTRTVGVVEVTCAGPSYRRFDEDPALPGLAAATDPVLMRDRLADHGRMAIERCAVTVVRYRPGRRAVVRYQLATAGGRVVRYGKLLGQARPLAATLSALDAGTWGKPTMPSIPAPVAVFDDLDLVVLPAAAGESLHRAITPSCRAAERVARFRRAGRAIAALHDGSGPSATGRPLTDDARQLLGDESAVRRAAPVLAAQLTDATDQAARAARDLSAAELVASHGALRTDQLHVSGSRVTLLDLDGYCRSPRARDVGNLFAYLRWKAIRQPRLCTVVAEARAAFRAGYGQSGHPPDEDAVRVAEAISLLKIAGRRFRNLSVEEWPQVPRLFDDALELLDGARQ
jgi:hypothetical protein